MVKTGGILILLAYAFVGILVAYCLFMPHKNTQANSSKQTSLEASTIELALTRDYASIERPTKDYLLQSSVFYYTFTDNSRPYMGFYQARQFGEMVMRLQRVWGSEVEFLSVNGPIVYNEKAKKFYRTITITPTPVPKKHY